MTAGTLTKAGLARLDEVMVGHVAARDVPGLAWLVARRGEVHTGVAGTLGVPGLAQAGTNEPGAGDPLAPDTIFRISSTTKPITAVAALILVEECRLRLDEPVDRLLPELADRRVLATPGGPLDDTVPARRPAAGVAQRFAWTGDRWASVAGSGSRALAGDFNPERSVTDEVFAPLGYRAAPAGATIGRRPKGRRGDRPDLRRRSRRSHRVPRSTGSGAMVTS